MDAWLRGVDRSSPTKPVRVAAEVVAISTQTDGPSPCAIAPTGQISQANQRPRRARNYAAQLSSIVMYDVRDWLHIPKPYLKLQEKVILSVLVG